MIYANTLIGSVPKLSKLTLANRAYLWVYLNKRERSMQLTFLRCEQAHELKSKFAVFEEACDFTLAMYVCHTHFCNTFYKAFLSIVQASKVCVISNNSIFMPLYVRNCIFHCVAATLDCAHTTLAVIFVSCVKLLLSAPEIIYEPSNNFFVGFYTLLFAAFSWLLCLHDAHLSIDCTFVLVYKREILFVHVEQLLVSNNIVRFTSIVT